MGDNRGRNGGIIRERLGGNERENRGNKGEGRARGNKGENREGEWGGMRGRMKGMIAGSNWLLPSVAIPSPYQ